MVVNSNLLKIYAWYDNEWGYSYRLADLTSFVIEKEKKF
ncbi:NAD-dependent glyceraldehyde-3-phosphate dehydrogenase [Prochlorococcus marinus str. MIT 9321]|uniref:NAD-dependent glyceraldehyde-3-phosphate dehydrogenase n=1 Tax=Prochlorococcus marinus str. MIT 9401 TaxID=167551 RepID=A0A0A2B065_PROMR|nr:NAD-dependent glyceraldehyde-3-phosphate dehydrogenase [Prochlorococcus marinus str. MIT 9322]KGG04991.1 NAD-dependent glyceraldehyde-3-phosphate dehydrogenase [Prochlorococcus marinus str. MIT 9321]KGG07236.1 NAD-dependent glyceraldehyde-3-phosphate dehydrogenase [Prochlorococcus marinus str. MIT 9401]